MTPGEGAVTLVLSSEGFGEDNCADKPRLVGSIRLGGVAR